MPRRVVVYESGCPEEGLPAAMLEGQPYELVVCPTLRGVLEQIVGDRAGALVFALCGAENAIPSALRLVRRAAPGLPLVLVVRDETLPVRRELQAFNPIYCAVYPPDPHELSEAVQAALKRSEATYARRGARQTSARPPNRRRRDSRSRPARARPPGRPRR